MMPRFLTQHKHPHLQAEILREAWEEARGGSAQDVLARAWLKHCMGVELTPGEADVLGQYIVVNATKRDREG